MSNEALASASAEAMPVQTTSDPFSSGRRWRMVRPGMAIGVMDLQLEEPFVYNSQTFPALCLSVVIEGFATNNMEGIEGGFCSDEVWISSTGESLPTNMTIHADRPVRVVELLLTPEWVSENEATMAGDAAFAMMAQSMRQPMMVRRRPLDARLRQIAWSALHPPMPGAFTDFHLDACAYILLGILAEHFHAIGDRPATETLGGKALQRILEVRQFIDADPVAVGSLAELAARFAISQSGLKRDFQLAFGVSPRDYLFERRMLIGRTAILRDRLTISQAAYKAGYDHPANFTAAFTRHFGYPPSTLKT